MGDVCTQMILDAEEAADYDSTQPVRRILPRTERRSLRPGSAPTW